MVKRLAGARLLIMAALFAGCLNNPSDGPATLLEGEWINAMSIGSWKSNSMTWSRLRVIGDSFHVTFNYAYNYCGPDDRPASKVVWCDDDDSTWREPCTEACARCDTVFLRRLVCRKISDTIGYAYASGRIAAENDSVFSFNGVMSDTFFVRCATGASDTMAPFSEKAVLSWYGDDTLMLTIENNAQTDEGIWLLVRGR